MNVCARTRAVLHTLCFSFTVQTRCTNVVYKCFSLLEHWQSRCSFYDPIFCLSVPSGDLFGEYISFSFGVIWGLSTIAPACSRRNSAYRGRRNEGPLC